MTKDSALMKLHLKLTLVMEIRHKRVAEGSTQNIIFCMRFSDFMALKTRIVVF
jgi:hypothetical protein